MTTNFKQGLQPIVCSEPKILILGSLPGDISIESQEYYANHKNFFWRIIATITGSPVPLSYPAKKEMLAQSHIALWDVYAAAERIGSSDGNIRGGEFNDIVGFIRKNSAIPCTGLTFDDLVNRWKDILIRHNILQGRQCTKSVSTRL